MWHIHRLYFAKITDLFRVASEVHLHTELRFTYKFKLSDVSVVDVGGAGITAEGEVYNLASPADLTGDVSAVTAGVTIIEGGSVAYLRNEKGVVIKLHSQTGGLRFNLSANGVHVTLQA